MLASELQNIDDIFINRKRKWIWLLEESLKAASVWEDVKDKLHKSALSLSGGQQQRVCIARVFSFLSLQ